jgi:hypothetical protein
VYYASGSRLRDLPIAVDKQVHWAAKIQTIESSDSSRPHHR